MSEKEVNRYQELRPVIMTADLIETAHNTGILSPGIRVVTREIVSHSAMAIRFSGFNLDDDLFVMEAWWPGGMRLRRLSRLVEESDHVVWHPLVGMNGVDAELRRRAAGWMLHNVGKGYDFLGALAAGFTGARPEDAELYCSEAVAMAYHSAGIIGDVGRSPAPGQFDRYKIHLDPVWVKRHWPVD